MASLCTSSFLRSIKTFLLSPGTVEITVVDFYLVEMQNVQHELQFLLDDFVGFFQYLMLFLIVQAISFSVSKVVCSNNISECSTFRYPALHSIVLCGPSLQNCVEK